MAKTEAFSGNTTDFGDFVKDEEEELDLEELVELWHRYDTEDNQNVLYPIYLGEMLNERYLVEHKLGFGGGLTVWMAFDLQGKREVALKVMALGNWSVNEIRIQDKIIKTVRDTSQTVASLHEAGIIHRENCYVDLNARNCMWGMAPIDALSRSAKYELLGRPSKQTIPFVNLWKRGELVSPVKVPEDLRTEEFYLCDFGLAKKIGDLTTPRGYPPMHYCSPDRLHKQEPSFACDMWSYMAIFSMLYLLFPPFPAFLEGGVVSGMVECLGPLPEQWKGLYTHPGGFDSWYDQSRSPDLNHDLAAKIAHFRPDADLAERQHVQSIMSKVFIYDPEKRPTAVELLRDPSFRAIMDR
ncbi:uncharacterized protein N7498_004871, partial [Penicillium cinerascens]